MHNTTSPVQDMCVVLDTYWRRHRLDVPIYLSTVADSPLPSPSPSTLTPYPPHPLPGHQLTFALTLTLTLSLVTDRALSLHHANHLALTLSSTKPQC